MVQFSPCVTADNLVSSTSDAISTTDSLSTGENADGSPSSSRQPRPPTLTDSPCYAVDRLGTLTVVSPASDGRQRVVGQKRVFACRPTLALEPLEHGGGLVGALAGGAGAGPAGASPVGRTDRAVDLSHSELWALEQERAGLACSFSFGE